MQVRHLWPTIRLHRWRSIDDAAWMRLEFDHPTPHARATRWFSRIKGKHRERSPVDLFFRLSARVTSSKVAIGLHVWAAADEARRQTRLPRCDVLRRRRSRFFGQSPALLDGSSAVVRQYARLRESAAATGDVALTSYRPARSRWRRRVGLRKPRLVGGRRKGDAQASEPNLFARR